MAADEGAAREVAAEAILPSVGERGRPLPLAAVWNTGIFHYTWPNRPRGFDPAYQVEQIGKGHHLLPSFGMPLASFNEEKFSAWLYPPFEKVRDWKLPFTLISTQWESALTNDPAYFELPAEENPNVVTIEGEILKKVDPFGPTALWYEVGKKLTAANPALKKMQELYPDPPLVIFLSNNEHGKLRWPDAESSRRYVGKFGTGKDGDFKRKVFADAWSEKYRALQKGMRDGLVNPAWKERALFIAYGGDVSADCLGRWGGWEAYSLHSKGRFDAAAATWDGVSPSYYLHNWSPILDRYVYSPQVEAMNRVFALRDAYEANPRFWFELSLWDGDSPNPKRKIKSKLVVEREAGHVFDAGRYRGFLQYGLWLLRPRAMREFRGWTDRLEDREEFFQAMVRAIDDVYASEVLQRYWRFGKLVPNRKEEHPYQSNLPREIRKEDRWFLLDADVNPPQPFESLKTPIHVFSLALELGEAPERTWLIYAHAPLKEYEGVTVTIPGYRDVKIGVSRGGSFHEVSEATGKVTAVNVENVQTANRKATP